MTEAVYDPKEIYNKFSEKARRAIFESLVDQEEFMLRTDCKQVIVVRRDLKLSPGKMAAQVAHASISFISSAFHDAGPAADGIGWLSGWFKPAAHAWLKGRFTKIIVYVDSEEELLQIHKEALASGLDSHLIKDAALSELPEPTLTCCGIGPEWIEDIDPITGNLPTR